MSTTQSSNPIPLSVFIALGCGILAISLASIFIRLAQDSGVPSLLIAGARLAIATLLLTPFVLRRHGERLRQLTRAEMGLAALSGVFLALHFATWISSLEYTSVLISVVLVTTSPIWAALLERLFLGARLQRAVLIGLAIVIVGGVVVALPAGGENVTVGSNPLLGGVLSLLGAVTVAAYLIIGRKVRAEMPLLPYIWLVYGCAALTLIVILLLLRVPLVGYVPESYLWMLALALLPQLVGHTSFNYALRYLPATLVGVISQMEPIGSAIMAFIIFQEFPGILAIGGGALILAGVLIATLGQTQKS
ncbi:MAG: DMT family transporter [Chloroflexi bacterium]|nr:DMT family transporter [Chloroflexota bacterium]